MAVLLLLAIGGVIIIATVEWYIRREQRECSHRIVRGIYGDEINFTPGFRRLQCNKCGKYLSGPVSEATV